MSVRVALYARVSTGEQDPEGQVATLRAYAERQGWEVSLVYREVVTGSGHRPRYEFDRLRSAIQAEAIEAVLVVKLDRIARSVRDALAIFEEAEAHRVRVVVTTQDIDTGTPAGRLTRTILAGVAEFEGELIRDRTRAAMAAIKAGTKQTRTGRLPGRPRRVTPEAVEKARALWRLNHIWADIAQQTGLKAETIRRAVWQSKRAPGAVDNTRSGESVGPLAGEVPRA